MGTVLQSKPPSNDNRHVHWDRLARASLFERYRELQAQGMSQRQAAQHLAVPRTTLQAWQVYQERLDAEPAVVAFFQSPPGLAFLHRLVVGLHLVYTEVGACGMRLVCLLLTLTGLDRFVGASYGTQQQLNRQVEEAIVTYRREESTRLAKDMPAKASPGAQDETFTGGLCVGAMEPDSNYLLLEQTAPGRDQDPWQTLMEQALAGLNGHIIHSTSDEAPGLLAYVVHPLGAHHSPDVFHVQQELVKAVSGPLAPKQRAASKAALEARERLQQGQDLRQDAGDALEAQRLVRSPQDTCNLKQAEHDAHAARQECERMSAQREQVAQSLRRIGQAYHFVDLDRGVRRNGQLIAADLYDQIGLIRPVAQQEGLSQSGLARIDKAVRGVPKMQATIAFVSGSVRQQVRQLDLTPPVSFAMHARLIPACSLERVAQTRTGSAGAPRRELAERLRAPLFEPGGAFAVLAPTAQTHLQQQAHRLAAVFQRSSSNVEGRNSSLSLRNHQLRGRERPRKRECLTAMHNFFRTRDDGTTAAERFFGQKPRSMFVAILGAVEIPPAPLSPPRWT